MGAARSSSSLRSGLALLVLVSLAPLAVAASRPDGSGGSGLQDRGILTGKGPATEGVPTRQPFFLGWTASVTSPAGLLKTPTEPGGVAVDPRSGWVYAGTRDGRVVCLSGGHVQWEAPVNGQLLAAPSVFREVVVAATAEGVLYVFNKVTGQQKARAVLGEELITQPVVADAPAGGTGLRAYVGSSAESLFAVDLELGQKLWRLHRDPPSGFTVRGFARPVVAPDVVFAAFADGAVVSVDPASGTVHWERKISPPGDLMDVDALALDSRHLLAASYSGGVYALDPRTGDAAWHTPLPGVGRLRVDGAQVFAVSPGLLTCLRAGDGATAWRFHYESGRSAATPVVSEDLVALAVADGPLYFVDRFSGAPEGVFGSGDGFESAPAADGNVLYALSNGGRIYSLAVVH